MGGRPGAVRRWDVITIGNLSRNACWGESIRKALRPVLCTCTLIQGDGFRLLVDPSVRKGRQMAAEIYRRTGLRPADVGTVFITHHHSDHRFGLKHFAHAEWFASAGEADKINDAGGYPRRVRAASGGLFNGALAVVASPGHTDDHHSLRFQCDGSRVVVAGDAVVTRDYWKERLPFHNAVDMDAATDSITKLTDMADIIVPGHDNYFVV
jgi:glyoxylase-like metal-dependent hydrolase (beta-lactamase superfamily II)